MHVSLKNRFDQSFNIDRMHLRHGTKIKTNEIKKSISAEKAREEEEERVANISSCIHSNAKCTTMWLFVYLSIKTSSI